MKRFRFIIIVVILAFLGLVFYPVLVLPSKDLVNKSLFPFSQRVLGVSQKVSNFFSNLSRINYLLKENQQLKEANLTFQSQLDQLKEIKHENEILRAELNFAKKDYQYDLISAEIVGLSPLSFLQTIKINKGSAEGVEKGKAVLSQGFMIGVIKEVTKNSSEVFLITNGNSLIPVVLSDSRGTGLLQGGLEGLTVREIPLDAEIKIGDSVVTSGLGEDLPRGLPLGQVEKIISKESEIFQKITVKSPIEFSRLEVVLVVK